MPNWVYNSMVLTGSEKDLKAFKNACYDEKGELSFKKILPRPAVFDTYDKLALIPDAILLYMTDNGTKELTEDQKKLFCRMEEYAKTDEEGHLINILRKRYDIEEIKRQAYDKNGNPVKFSMRYSMGGKEIGPTSTYMEFGEMLVRNFELYGAIDWYGWNCNNWGTKWDASDFEEEESSPGTLNIRFDTAWSHPVGIIRKIAHEFPNISISLYCEEEQGFGFEATLYQHKCTITDLITSSNDEENDDAENEEKSDEMPAVLEYGAGMAFELNSGKPAYDFKEFIWKSRIKSVGNFKINLSEFNKLTASV